MKEYDMNDETHNAISTTPPPLPGANPPPDAAASDDTTVGQLLKSPQSVVLKIMADKNLAAESAKLIGVTALCYAVFGIAVGLFGGWGIAAMTVWKAPLIALCAMLLCLPSLYVFTAVLGSPISLRQAFALGSACLAMTGLIVVGLSPVAWLFSVSTESLPFVTIMTFIIWLIALPFASRFLHRAGETGLLKHQGGLKVWFVILIVVTLQMTTVMRPILTAPAEGERIIATGKMFFLRHFGNACGM